MNRNPAGEDLRRKQPASALADVLFSSTGLRRLRISSSWLTLAGIRNLLSLRFSRTRLRYRTKFRRNFRRNLRSKFCPRARALRARRPSRETPKRPRSDFPFNLVLSPHEIRSIIGRRVGREPNFRA
jgi:hypothetical protein